MNDDIPNTRAAAKALGEKHYFTGAPCPHGHIGIRFTSTGGCNECLKVKARNYNRRNKEARASYSKEWKVKNASHVSAYNAKYHKETYALRREAQIEYSRQYYLENKRSFKEYADRNRSRIRGHARKRYHIRYRNDPDFRMAMYIRSLLQRTLQLAGERKHRPTEEMLGYSAQDLRHHLERQFVKGMGWHNRSEWHIDHITPVSWFLKNGITDPKRINCLSNLRPMWAADNYRKKARRTTLL